MHRKSVSETPFSVRPLRSVAELEDKLSEPSPGVVDVMSRLDGDLLILGVGGKMGPSLAQLAVRAIAASGVERRVIAVSSLSVKGLRKRLETMGIETVQGDLLEPGVLESLPDIPNVIYMVGRKFGSTGAEWLTWATNVHLPALVAQRFKDSRIVAFSSGNVYPLESVLGGGSTESTPPDPVGEYAITCLGRERMFEHFSRLHGTKVLLLRLNYAAELRYGVLVDMALQVRDETPIDLTMGHLNCVWQGYANSVALQGLAAADSPPRVLNLTGPELVPIRWAATRLGSLMGKKPAFAGQEAGAALLSNATACHRLFGYPQISLDTLIEWVAYWIMNNGEVLDKPTHFETRNGRF
jgi:nucleoside-diphosphate-sugar epimerase